jgi:hypothetical protein
MKNPRPPSVVVRGLYKLIGLLAAVTLQQIHRIYGYCVASNVVLVHGCLLNILFRFGAGPPLYTGNDTPVITQYVVVTACRFVTCQAAALHFGWAVLIPQGRQDSIPKPTDQESVA